MSACNNKPQSGGDVPNPTTDSLKAVSATRMPCDTCVTGGGTAAVVYIDKTNYVGINAATVQAQVNGAVVKNGTATTNENGQYAFTGLANGTYTIVASCPKTYTSTSIPGIAYNGTTSSLPAVPLDSLK
jgi:hypothetical protein